MSVCVVCGTELTGRQTKLCSDRECRREWKREYDRKHGPTYRLNNQEKIKEKDRKYYQSNKEKQKEYSREYHRKNPEKIKENKRRYYQEHREQIKESKLESSREYYRLSRGLPEDCDLSKESSIETIMKKWLLESDIDFVQHYYIDLKNSTRTWVDFFIPEPNICLYCDGDYWHGPERPDIQERDGRINKALEGMAYSVVRMTEEEILEGNRPWWIGELISAKW